MNKHRFQLRTYTPVIRRLFSSLSNTRSKPAPADTPDPTTPLAELCVEYAGYVAKHDLPAMSADELLLEEAGKGHEAYLQDFVARWEQAEEAFQLAKVRH